MQKKENRFQLAARKREVLKNNGLKPSSEDRAMGQGGLAAIEGMKDMSAMLWGGIPAVFIKNTPVVFWSGFVVTIAGHYTGYRWLRRLGMGAMAAPVIKVATELTGIDPKLQTKERFKVFKDLIMERFGINNLLKNQNSENTTNPIAKSSITDVAGLGNIKYFNYQPDKNQRMSLNGNEVPGMEILKQIEEQYLQQAREFQKTMTADQKRAAGIPVNGLGEAESPTHYSTPNVLYGTIEERLF